jgi:hypothetical protein
MKQVREEDLINYFDYLTMPASSDVVFFEEELQKIEQYMYELEIPKLKELWSRRHTSKLMTVNHLS